MTDPSTAYDATLAELRAAERETRRGTSPRLEAARAAYAAATVALRASAPVAAPVVTATVTVAPVAIDTRTPAGAAVAAAYARTYPARRGYAEIAADEDY